MLEFPSASQESFQEKQRLQERKAFDVLETIRTDAERIHAEIIDKYAETLESVEEDQLVKYIKDPGDAKLWRIWTEYIRGGHSLDRDIELYANEVDRHTAATFGLNKREIGIQNVKSGSPDVLSRRESAAKPEINRKEFHQKLITKLQALAVAYDNAKLDKNPVRAINILARYDIQVWAENVRDYLNAITQRREDDASAGSKPLSKVA